MQCITIENGVEIVELGHEQHKVMVDVGGDPPPPPDEHFFLTIVILIHLYSSDVMTHH